MALAGCTAAMATLVPVAAHQLGLVRHLPDPPSTLFDSDRITNSPMAHPYGIPDALLGLGSYGATLLLLLAARRRSPIAGKLLAAKLAADTAAAAFNSVRQVTKFRRVCSWCVGTAVATGVMAVCGFRFLRD
jgi:uncharacterized membrane protein